MVRNSSRMWTASGVLIVAVGPRRARGIGRDSVLVRINARGQRGDDRSERQEYEKQGKSESP